MTAFVSRFGFHGPARAAATADRPAYVVAPAPDKASALAAFAAALDFPAWFGGNYDALADAVGDLSWLPPGPKTLVWDGAVALRSRHPEVYATIREILAERGPGDLDVVILMR